MNSRTYSNIAINADELVRRKEEGLKRASVERAIAAKEFWNWLTRSNVKNWN